VLQREKTSLSATDVVYELKNLKTILQERKELFYSTESQIILLEESSGVINSKTFIEEVDAFYGSCASYIFL
jgi:hypothetical protein